MIRLFNILHKFRPLLDYLVVMALTAAAVPTLYEYYTSDGINSGLSVDQPYFTLNNKNITLYSGAMHYFRIPRQHWRDRLRKLRATGLNTVETYVPWNLHEPQNGTYDFGQGGSDMQDFLDVQEFLKIAQEEDLLAIVRPGPYICAEWEWGGFPSWLLREEGIQVRTSDSKYMDYVRRYFSMLLPLLAVFQFMNGGPVIAFQVENEYGYSTYRDLEYIRELYDIFRDNGLTELLFTSDGVSSGQGGTVPELLFQTANFGSDPQWNLDQLASLQPGKPLMVMEYYPGWFDHWSEVHHTTSTDSLYDVYSNILKYPASVNIYMFHGGTNWGLLNGANMGAPGSNSDFQPTTTSYDYDAPLSEAGDYNPKYNVIKELIQQYNPIELFTPEVPELIPRVVYPDIAITSYLTFEDILGKIDIENIIESSNPVPMELLPINNNNGQSYGYTIYRKTNINIPTNSELVITGYVYDTVMVLVNNVLISNVLNTSDDLNGFGYWRLENSNIILTTTDLINATIDLVVENWGRGNFGQLEQQFKGLQDSVLINGEEIQDWLIYPLEFTKKWNQNLSDWKIRGDNFVGPALYRGTFTVDEPTDTYFDLQQWSKGVVIINNFILGKYAKIGPQQSLYLPGPFLKTGENEVIIFEHFEASSTLKFSQDPIFITP